MSLAVPIQDALDHVLSSHQLTRARESELGCGDSFESAEHSQETDKSVQSLRKKSSFRNCGGSRSRRLTLKSKMSLIGDDRNHWKLTVVADLIKRRDGIVRAAKLRSSKETVERAVQHLYSLDLTCVEEPRSTLNPVTPEFETRP